MSEPVLQRAFQYWRNVDKAGPASAIRTGSTARSSAARWVRGRRGRRRCARRRWPGRPQYVAPRCPGNGSPYQARARPRGQPADGEPPAGRPGCRRWRPGQPNARLVPAAAGLLALNLSQGAAARKSVRQQHGPVRTRGQDLHPLVLIRHPFVSAAADDDLFAGTGNLHGRQRVFDLGPGGLQPRWQLQRPAQPH